MVDDGNLPSPSLLIERFGSRADQIPAQAGGRLHAERVAIAMSAREIRACLAKFSLAAATRLDGNRLGGTVQDFHQGTACADEIASFLEGSATGGSADASPKCPGNF
jgi:hypothetical protein